MLPRPRRHLDDRELHDALPISANPRYRLSNLFFLKNAQVHVGLGHPPQRRFQSPVTTVTDIIGAEHNLHRLLHRLPRTPTHPRPTESFFTPAPSSLPAHARLPFRRSCPCSIPAGLPSPFLSPFPSLFSPIYYSDLFTSALSQS